MTLNVEEFIRRAKEYVELEAQTEVKEVTFEEKFRLFGQEDIVLSVSTTDEEHPEWWVIGGATPMNLYAKDIYATSDEAFSLHAGLMMRIAARDYEESEERPVAVGYDAFISHASEDKETFVKPLAEELSSMGFWIWYDEFELKVGDSLRQSIDQGLVNSEYGIVILSPAFFGKNWPQYELNGLTAREIQGKKVILPIWHNVDQGDVLAYSPALADKVALNSQKMKLKDIAEELAATFAEGGLRS